MALSCSAKSSLTSEIVASKRQGPGRPGPLLSTFAVLPPPTPGAGFEMEALEAHFLPSSRLANEAAGTTLRFIQASASPPLPHGRGTSRLSVPAKPPPSDH